MANEITPDANGNVTFRKSLFDDDGDTITISSVRVIMVNSADVTPSQPAWLDYTTTEEQTAEGPKSNRLYQHVDFTIDSQHTDIDQGSLYTIEITADDGINPPKTFRFLYTNGYFDLSSVSGMTLWISARKEAAPTALPTDFSSNNFDIKKGWSNYRMELPGFSANIRDNQPAFDFTVNNYASVEWNGSVLPTTGSPNPSGPEIQPFHMYFVVLSTDYNFKYFDVEGSDRTLRLRKSQDDVELYVSTPGTNFTRYISNKLSSTGEDFHLLELHRYSDGSAELILNGAVEDTFTLDGYFGDFNGIGYEEDAYLFELIAYQYDLTVEQRQNIRKTLKGLYPSLPFSL